MIDNAVRLAGRTASRFGRRRLLDIDGRVVFVTGAARGLGAEVARQAYARGAYVALVGRRLQSLQQLADALGDRAAAFEADVTDPVRLQRAADDTVGRFGGIDVVVANAGISSPTETVAAIEASEFEHTIDVDLLGQWRTARTTIAPLIERRGHILFVGSIYAFFNGVLAAPYAMSKAGVEQLARALRVELASHGVTAGYAYFGFIQTDLSAAAFANERVALMRQANPAFLTRPIPVSDAAAAALDGIQRRAARVAAPWWIKAMLASRSVTTTVMDYLLMHSEDVERAVNSQESGVGKVGT